MRLTLLLAMAMLAAAPAAARDSLGIFEDWAAFRDPARGAAPLRCYAIAEPERADSRGFYATIGHWPASRVRGQLYIHLPRSTRGTATLTVGSRRFTLSARGGGLWAAGRADHESDTSQASEPFELSDHSSGRCAGNG